MWSWPLDSFRPRRIQRILDTSGEKTERTPAELLLLAWMLGFAVLTFIGFLFLFPVGPVSPSSPLSFLTQGLNSLRSLSLFKPIPLTLESLILFWLAHRLPVTWYLFLRYRRMLNLDREIIHVFTVVASCLRVGLSFEHSLREVMQNHRGLLKKPVLEGLEKINTGLDPDKVWGEMTRSVGNSDFSAIIHSALLLKKQGAMVNNALSLQIESLTAKRQERFKRNAARVQIWSRFVLILCVLPALAASIVAAVTPMGFWIFFPYGWSLLFFFFLCRYVIIGWRASPPA